MSSPRRQKPFAAFDIDGTIARTSLYHQLVEELIKRKLLPETIREQYEEPKQRWQRREHPEAFTDYVWAMVHAYEPLMPTVAVQDFEDAASYVAERVKKHTYVYTRSLARRLKKQGYFLIAISGSQREIVGPFAKHYGFDDFVAYEFEKKNDKYTGKTNVTYTNKDRILRQLIKKHNLSLGDSIAVGDSSGDIELLAMTENPIAFNPEKKLLAAAKKNGWKIVVERKNVIYELEPRDGKYILAKTNA